MIVQLTLTGLSIGAIYAILALGLTLILNATDVVNVAQGDLAIVAAIVAATAFGSRGLALPLAVGIALMGTVCVTALVFVLMELSSNRLPLTLVMVTLGCSIVLEAAGALAVGTLPLFMSVSGATASVYILGGVVTRQVIVIFVVGGVVMAALGILFNRTLIGQAILACNLDRGMADLLGIDSRRLVLMSVLLGGLLAGIAGVLVIPLISVTVYNGLDFTLKAFTAAVLGGLGKPAAAVTGGLLLGLIEAYSAGFVSSAFQNVIVFGLLLGLLILRPQGLFGSKLTTTL